MDSTDLQVLRIAIDWLLAGHRIMLVTVAATWGSAPRPPGAWAAVRDDGVLTGSVSGGCIEDDLVQRVRKGLLTKNEHRVVDIVTYGVTREEAARFGLPCGGTLRLVIETSPDVQALQQLLARTEKGELTARTLDLATGQVTLADATAQDTLIWNEQRLVTLHGPQLRLLIIGAGQISHYLASMAQALDYAVIVCDPREEYRAAWQVTNTQLVADMPDDAVLALIPDARTAIVAVTHDPKLDDLALLEALKSPAFYVGALGSRTNTAKRKERLGQYFDLSLEELNRLHGPVGLPIGSRTPAEIAVSILAEMTAVRHGMQSPIGEQKTTTTAANTCPIR